MKTTFTEARRIVEAAAADFHDETVPLSEMSFVDLGAVKIAGRTHEMLPSAQRLVANKLRVPQSYIERCSYELQAENLNYWLEQEKRQRDTFFCRFDGMKLRAVFTDRYKAVDNREILQKMEACGFQPDAEVHLSLNGSLMVVKVPDYGRMFELGSDKMAPGIAVANSEVGVLAFSIEAYFYRLVCTNGLISKTQVSSKFRHISLRALDEFDATLEQVVRESRFSQGRLAESTERIVTDPPATIESFNRQFQLTRKEGEAVARAWEIEPGNTMFSVINAYTRAAQDRELSGEERHQLERVGGQILALIK
jgi:hypothetical protein